MILVATVILLHSAGLAGSMPGVPGVPENITVTFLNPTSVRVSWDTTVDHVDKYDVTYKPTDASYRVVAVVAGNSDAVTLSGLKADTQYQLTVAAVWGGRKYRSRPIVFRTLEPPRTSPQQDVMGVSATSESPPREFSDPPDVEYPQTSSTVRGVEIGIVLIVLLVWVAAIALFFNRWGKIRMLLPYQPDYKQEQLKVPGTAACAAAVAAGNTCNHHSGELCTQIPDNLETKNVPSYEIHTPSTTRRSRPRLNSAIFTSYSGPGFDSKEFLRRHGSQSKLCRKARSVDNISLEDNKHFGLPMLSISGPSPPEDEEDMAETDQFIRSDL
ncbi:PREDICTED: fibronectin type III domain-containing protein 4 isoform X3 [Nicrophorus vespilloides]|uniref:Fibronectin type III domain-containing protein 4 isoform X3 n=1 Tax=Nicrophorus vespilloides TaxID=110193 RepID=A0ABM1MX80_NICVS|nr:PREDICTED: fibronectin type III domain-containing protein 4 isoform X3 [Nicrophorus vespilloides]